MALLPMNTAKHFGLFMNGGCHIISIPFAHLVAYRRESTNLDVFALRIHCVYIFLGCGLVNWLAVGHYMSELLRILQVNNVD